MKPRLVGVIGATGTGKTSLCEYTSELPFIKTDVSGVYKGLGLHPRDEMPFQTRLMAQTAILDHHVADWEDQLAKYKSGFVLTDRSPICFMTYTLAEVSGYRELTNDDEQCLLRYIEQCRGALVRYFSGMFHLMMSGPFIVDESDGKVRARVNKGYHAHYQALSLGLMVDNMPKERYVIDEHRHIAYRHDSLKNLLAKL